MFLKAGGGRRCHASLSLKRMPKRFLLERISVGVPVAGLSFNRTPHRFSIEIDNVYSSYRVKPRQIDYVVAPSTMASDGPDTCRRQYKSCTVLVVLKYLPDRPNQGQRQGHLGTFE
jgi:hypothetical protein